MPGNSNFNILAVSPEKKRAIDGLTTPARNLMPPASAPRMMQDDSTGASSGGVASPARVSAGSTLDGYTIALYENGFQAASTGTASCDVFPLAVGADLPAGFPLLVFPAAVRITGGSDEE